GAFWREVIDQVGFNPEPLITEAQIKVGQDYDFFRPISTNKRMKQVRALRAEFGIGREPWWWEWPADPCFCISSTTLRNLVYWLEYSKPRPIEIKRKTPHSENERKEGAKLPFKKNKGLGLYDRRGHRLPQFALTTRRLTSKKPGKTPFLCLKPIASI